jgi:hypothetical protein
VPVNYAAAAATQKVSARRSAASTTAKVVSRLWDTPEKHLGIEADITGVGCAGGQPRGDDSAIGTGRVCQLPASCISNPVYRHFRFLRLVEVQSVATVCSHRFHFKKSTLKKIACAFLKDVFLAFLPYPHSHVYRRTSQHLRRHRALRLLSLRAWSVWR